MHRHLLISFLAWCLMIGNAAGVMTEYCQTPPFITTSAAPNVLLMVDASGSMGWKAYSFDGNNDGSPDLPYDPTKVYEGYFDPTRDYMLDPTDITGNTYMVDDGSVTCPLECKAPATLSCNKTNVTGNCLSGQFGCSGSKKWACCSGDNWTTSVCGINGNYLNYQNMARIDLLRWAMTGGKPAGCANSIKSCDPGTSYPDSQLTCDASGCTLLTNSGIKVKASWARITGEQGGLLYQFQNLPLQPRLGVMFFSEEEVRSAATVLLGDFVGSASIDAVNPYKNTITQMNTQSSGGATPSGPALWAAYAYLAQNPSEFGSPGPATGGVEWKDPMYQCFDANNDGNCQGNELVSVPCAKNFIIMLTDGQWNMGGQDKSVAATCTIDTAYEKPSADPVVPAYWLHKKGFTNAHSGEWSSVEALYGLGLWLGGTGGQSLQHVSMYGGFNVSQTWPGNMTNYPLNYCWVDDCSNYTYSKGRGSACTPLPPSSPDWDTDGNNIPDTFFAAENALEIKNRIMAIIMDILKKASSGTAVSVLSSSEGSGANLMQALFYPNRTFAGGTEVAWTSDLMNYWYYLDPFFTSATIREDTIREGAVAASPYTLLNLQQDYVTSFAYDTTVNKTLAHRWLDATGKGTPRTDMGSVPIEETIPIWRAGFDLWWTLPTARNIYTSVDVTAATTSTPAGIPSLIPFTVLNRDAVDDFLGQTASTVDANATINFVRGYDCIDATGAACVCGTAGCNKIGRNRTVTSGICSTRKSPCGSAADCPTGEICESATNVWKFGDVISSTPRIMGPGYLNNYNVKSPFGYNDATYRDFINSTDYQNRQLVFVGANDGMLHAFKLGKLLQKWTGKQWYEAAKQEGDTGVGGIGTESWAYIPKNVLPYLQYTHDEDYCHIYMVDGPTTISDVAIHKPSTSFCTEAEYWNCPKQTTVDATTKLVDFDKTSWRTILVGSAGIGGATCDAASPDVDRISTPISVGGNPVGWSSYYALDVTDQTTPKLLWEFSNPDLGVTNVGPAIVKVGGNEKRCAINNVVCSTDSNCDPVATKGGCTSTNGRWLAVLASGSTGPISNLEFKGMSDKNLRIFVLDLKTGALLRTIDTGITNAFAGSISSSALDLEKDRPIDSGNYQDDALYIGYTKDITSGGVLRLVINDDIDPDHWTVSKVIDGTGPITTSVVNLLDRKNKKLWIYFGEGRYFYKLDDPANQRRLYGIEEPCFDAVNNTILPTCGSSLATADLKDQTTAPSTTLTATEKGWFVNMNPAAGTNGAERIISNPTPDPLGAIFFLSFAPTSDICSFGGTTYLWAMDYKTGGAVTYTLQGKALIQVSTGEIKELNLKDALTENDNRKSLGFKGIPPTGQGLMILSPPVPIKKFMHVQEQ